MTSQSLHYLTSKCVPLQKPGWLLPIAHPFCCFLAFFALTISGVFLVFQPLLPRTAQRPLEVLPSGWEEFVLQTLNFLYGDMVRHRSRS
jgi:hypothetical protein